jgi:hypothetical protein
MKVRAILSKKSITAGITIPTFKLYYRAIPTKKSMALAQNRHEDQWNRIEDPDMNPHDYIHLSFDKGSKTINGERTASLTNAAEETGYLHAEN